VVGIDSEIQQIGGIGQNRATSCLCSFANDCSRYGNGNDFWMMNTGMLLLMLFGVHTKHIQICSQCYTYYYILADFPTHQLVVSEFTR